MIAVIGFGVGFFLGAYLSWQSVTRHYMDDVRNLRINVVNKERTIESLRRQFAKLASETEDVYNRFKTFRDALEGKKPPKAPN